MFDRDDSGAVDNYELESFMEVLKGETNVGRTESPTHKKGYAGKREGEVAGRGEGGRV